jgi:TonB family protein
MAALAVSARAQTPLPPVSIPKPRSFVEMGYPAPALESQTQGTAVVRAALDDTGHVTSAEALAGPPTLAPAAVANIRQWTFEPGPRSAVVVYRFEIDYGRCNDDTRGLFRLPHDNMVVLTTCKGPTRRLGTDTPHEQWIGESGEAVYPPLAQSARVTGPVVLSLTLDRRGKVTSAEALSGSPLLSPSAIAHARSWRMTSYSRLPRQMVVVYEFGLALRDCVADELRRVFWQADSGHVHLDACSPLVQVSSQTRPKP